MWCNNKVDTWSQKRYTWFHWPRHAPGASLQCVYLSPKRYIKCIHTDTHNFKATLWQWDNIHSSRMGHRPFILRWSLQSCLSSALFIHCSVEQKRKLHSCHYWQDTGITKMCWCMEERSWILVIEAIPKCSMHRKDKNTDTIYCSCCCADRFPWASVYSLAINMTANLPSHSPFMSFFLTFGTVFTI